MSIGGGDRQIQSAGESSQQNQASNGGSVVVYNVTFNEAQQVFDEQQLKVLAELSAIARQHGSDRVSEFTSRALNALQAKHHLGAVADPAFQIATQEAQRTAAKSGSEADYDRLVELLTIRAANAHSRPVLAGVDQAIAVVANVDARALRALSILVAVSGFTAAMAKIADGLQVLNDVYADLGGDDLPQGRGWVDHLDSLNLLRELPSSLQIRKPFNDLFVDRHVGYVSPGLTPQAFKEVNERLVAGGSFEFVAVPHEFDEARVRLPFATQHQFDETLDSEALLNAGLNVELAREEGKAACHFGEVDITFKQRLIQEIESYSTLSAVGRWWNGVPATALTASGRVLANANMLRIRPDLPVALPDPI